MQTSAQAASVIAYYDAHPINEQQILHTLAARGIALDGLTEEILKDHDQDHFGGIEANDLLIAKAGIAREHVVLDVCSGMGGPARYLALRVGCRVVGLDFTESRHLAAQRLTKLVGLDHLVSFRHGNALEMPFEDASFDAVIGQEAWCHVPEKPRLIAECARVVKPGGVDRLQRHPAQGRAVGDGDGAPDARDDLPDPRSLWRATQHCWSRAAAACWSATT